MSDPDFYFKITGLDALAEDLRKMEKAYPQISLKYTRRAGAHFRRSVMKRTRETTDTRTGNLLKGYRMKVTLQSGSLHAYEAQISGGNGKAHHFHLVENGHVGKIPDRSGRMHTFGRVAGRHMMEQTVEKWEHEKKLLPYAQKALDEALKKGGF